VASPRWFGCTFIIKICGWVKFNNDLSGPVKGPQSSGAVEPYKGCLLGVIFAQIRFAVPRQLRLKVANKWFRQLFGFQFVLALPFEQHYQRVKSADRFLMKRSTNNRLRFLINHVKWKLEIFPCVFLLNHAEIKQDYNGCVESRYSLTETALQDGTLGGELNLMYLIILLSSVAVRAYSTRGLSYG